MTKQDQKQTAPLLAIQNQHVDPAPVIPVDGDTYVSYFESNGSSDQWVFTRRRGAEAGTLYGGDLGWDPVEIRAWTPAQVREQLAAQGVPQASRLDAIFGDRLDPLAPGVILAADERAWLNTAWWASSDHDDLGSELVAIAERIVEQIPGNPFAGHPNTHEFRAAMTTVAFMAGQAAGMRGMSERDAQGVMGAVIAAIRKRQH